MTTQRTVLITIENKESALNLTPNEIFKLELASIENPLPNPIIMLGLEKENSDKLLADLPIIWSTSKDKGVLISLYVIDSTYTAAALKQDHLDYSKRTIYRSQQSNSLTLYEIHSKIPSTEKV